MIGVIVRVLALDIGSSSVKGAVVEGTKILGLAARVAFATRYDGTQAEVDAATIRRAVIQITRELSVRARGVDVLSLCAMAPSWVAMDGAGNALTPVVTHQDRRSIVQANLLEKRIGRWRHLRITGNRPFPGGISSTTALWYAQNHPAVLKRAELVGHLGTYLLRAWTGARVTDPSNASFMGVYHTCTLGGWSEELLAAAGLKMGQMPELHEANQVVARLSAEAARELSLRPGLPVLPGIMDSSAAMLHVGTEHGTLLNTSGSTDVLALCVDKPHPNELLLTRALGVGKKWLAVSTLASAGTTLTWLHQTLFAELSDAAFYRMVGRVVKMGNVAGDVGFEPYLAGSRLSIEQRQGVFTGLTLGTARVDMLRAAVDALAKAGGSRIAILRERYGAFSSRVHVTGGVGVALASVLHRDWPGTWTFVMRKEATLLGLAKLADLVK